jgi:hypothetical protein
MKQRSTAHTHTLSPLSMADPLDKPLVRQTKSSFISRLAHAIFVYPIELFLSLISSVLRPVAPQLIPLAVFFLLVPLLVIPAILSGVYVWYSRAVSWQSSLFFQYGYVLTHIRVYVLMSPEATDFHRLLKLNSPPLTLHNPTTYLCTSLSRLHSPTMISGTS